MKRAAGGRMLENELRSLTVRFMCAALLAFGGGAALQAQVDAGMTCASSLSGQFYARERQPLALAHGPEPRETTALGYRAFVFTAPKRRGETNADKLTLEPALLAISSERVKTKFLQALGLSDGWQSRIELLIDRDLAPPQMPRLAVVGGRGNWQYQLQLPNEIAPPALMRALVSALLVEMANRNNHGRESADVPVWLIEGLSAHLLANSLPTLFLQPGTELPGDRVTIAGQAGIRRWLRRRAPLTFEELSAPAAAPTEDDKAFYEACAQLFFEELLTFKDGQADLRQMMRELGTAWSWQQAFLEAFRGHFGKRIDVEKWWGLACVDFENDEIGGGGSTAEAWKRLQRTLDVPVAVELAKNRSPAEARITLQEALVKWDDTTAQAETLRAISQLEVEIYRSPAEMRPLIEEYLAALNGYVADRGALERKGDTVRNKAAQLAVLKDGLKRRLQALDEERDGLRQKLVLTEKQPTPRRK